MFNGCNDIVYPRTIKPLSPLLEAYSKGVDALKMLGEELC